MGLPPELDDPIDGSASYEQCSICSVAIAKFEGSRELDFSNQRDQIG